jgi:hypothetical protein
MTHGSLRFPQGIPPISTGYQSTGAALHRLADNYAKIAAFGLSERLGVWLGSLVFPLGAACFLLGRKLC